MSSNLDLTASGSDVVWGAANIGREINVSPRRAFYLLERRLIPGRKIGDTWQSTRSELRAAMLGDAARTTGAPTSAQIVRAV